MTVADRTALLALTVIASLLGAPEARADSPPNVANASVAEAIFRDGVTLFDAGKIHEACAKFGESYRLDPENGTLQNLALCHVREGKRASAWAEFALLAGRAAQAGQKAREQMARQQVTELEPALARVALVFPRASGVDAVLVDGEALGRAAWSTPLPLDPGEHVLVFRGTRKKDATARVRVPDHAAMLRVDVAVLEAADDAPREPTAIVHDEPVQSSPPPSSTQRTASYVVGGAGVVLIGVGAYFGLTTLSKKHEGDTHCTGALCDAQGIELEDQAHTSATWSTITFGAGLAALAAGVVLLVTSPSEDASRSARLHFVPSASARGAGGSLVLRW